MTRGPLQRIASWLMVGPNSEFVIADLDDGYRRLRHERGQIHATVWYVVMMVRSAYSLRMHELASPRYPKRRVRPGFENLLTDARLGVRLAIRHPASSLTVVVVMSLGIAVATFGFGVHYGMFVRGLPVTHPERMVDVSSTAPSRGVFDMGMSVDDFHDIRTAQTSMDDLALWGRSSANLSRHDAPPIRVAARVATPSLYQLLEFRPRLGRLPTDEDSHAGTQLSVLLSESLWYRHFASDSNVVGRTVFVNGEAATIIGVIPGFPSPAGEMLYVPLRPGSALPQRRAERDFWVLGRLRASVTLADADREFQLLAANLNHAFPETNRGIGARVVSFIDGQVGSASSFSLLSFTCALTLLIAIANITNLYLVHASGRSRELRIRMALGAGRWRVVSLFFSEAFLPVCAGAAGGAWLAAMELERYGNRLLASWEQYDFTGAHFLFVVGVTILTLLFIGFVAGLQVRTRTLSPADGDRGNTDRRFSRIGRLMVTGEIAFGGALLFVAGLMVKTAFNLSTIDYGFAIDNVMTARVLIDEARYTTAETRLQFWNALGEALRAEPGVEAAALSTHLPMIRYRAWTQFRIDGIEPRSAGEYPGANRNAVAPEFFDTFDKSITKGRAFTAVDNADAEPVVIVNEDFVAKFFPDGNALDRRIQLGGPESTEPWMRVVGVAPHMWMDTDVDRFPEGMYVPLAQHVPEAVSISLRVAGDPKNYADVIRESVFALDRQIPIDEMMTMPEVIDMRTTVYRQLGPRYIVLGVAALALSMIGLYAVMSYVAQVRMREIGIRRALGAQTASIVRFVLAQGFTQVAVGVVLGVAIALYTSRGLSRLVFQMEPWDPWVLLLSFGTLTLTAIAAILIPARKALRVDPLVTLRLDA